MCMTCRQSSQQIYVNCLQSGTLTSMTTIRYACRHTAYERGLPVSTALQLER